MKELNKQDYLEIYRLMTLTRHTEEMMAEYYTHTPYPESPHSSTGQEAIAIGACYGLRKDDLVIPSLRTRGAFLAKGVSSRTMMAGAFGKVTGAARGKATSHHLGDLSVGVVSGTGIIGSHLPVGVGTALAAKLRSKDYVTVVFFGDGASNRGDFHEALNMAAIYKVPVVFVCENNGYAISTPQSYSMAIKDIADRAAGYGIPGVIIDGNDFFAVYEATQTAYERARKGEGPTLIECKTYRWRPHSGRDVCDSRPPEELAEWKKRCPIQRFTEFITSKGIATEEELKAIEQRAIEEVKDAIKFAEESPMPAGEETLLNVYAPAKEVR